jgi:predicted nucleotidyltransferase
MATHAIAAGALRRHGVDCGNHQGMAHWLDRNGYSTVASAFRRWKQSAWGAGMGGKGMAIPLTTWTSFSQRLKRGPWPEEVTTRLKDALDAFSRNLRDLEGVVAVVLFGSYARGDFGRKSDVDLLVLARSDSRRSMDEIGTAVARASIDAETGYRLPMDLAPLVADASKPEELGPDLVHAIWSDGVVLFAEASALAALKPTDLSPWTVVRFSAAGLPPSRGVRLSRRLHGRGQQKGLVAPPAVELGRGAMLLPAAQTRAVRDALDEAGTVHDLIPVWRPV